MDNHTDIEFRTLEHSIPLDILSDLLSRFIINVPEAAKQTHIRICFQIELAYWYYLDFYVNNDNMLKSCSFNDFAAHVYQHLPLLQPHYSRLSEILVEWREYKQSVPTYGAILLCEDNSHVLLVQSYWAKTSWGFPKGKVNEDEDPAHCAIREVYEETGFDITTYLDPNNYFESTINDQLIRLYVITGIPMITKFQPRTRFEIKACEWFQISDLPNSKKDNTPKMKVGISPNAFFMVLPFVKRIKNLSQSNNKNKRQRYKSSSLSEGESNNKSKQNLSNNNNKAQNKVNEKSAINNGEKKERKQSGTKRQLFNQSEKKDIVFSAPSWLNFKFDRAAIMDSVL